MEFQNHKITESVCAFRFDPQHNNWDITHFSEYYNAIKSSGFIRKEEIKPLRLSFQINPSEGLANTHTHMQQGDVNMVYKNESGKYAILVGRNYISFHILNHYPGWEVFNEELIVPSFEKYLSMGVGKGLLNAQMIYINHFEIEQGKRLDDYLTFVPNMEHFGDGDELSHMFQSSYEISPNKQLQLKTMLNVSGPERTKRVTLECNCIANNQADFCIDWKTLSSDAHNSSRNAFIQVSSDYFKDLIR